MSAKVRSAFEDRTNEICFSASSAWEIAIKHNIGQIELPTTPSLFIATRIADYSLSLLEITLDHALAAGGLPMHHKDPFDRMLIAQARLEGIPIATPDKAFATYDVDRFW